MNIWFLLFVIVLLVLISYLIKNKVVLHFGTFFRKGFKKISDKYGIYTFERQTTALGKTYSAIDFIENIRHNRKVISNVYSYYLNNKDYVIYESDIYKIIDNFKKGLYPKDTIIFYDELFSMIQKGKLDRKILTFISQFRKRGIYFITTAQEWLEIDVTFRRYSRYVIHCKMITFFKLFAISINEIEDGYQIKWDKEENEYVAPRIKTTIKKCSKKIADSYDTFEVINEL